MADDELYEAASLRADHLHDALVDAIAKNEWLMKELHRERDMRLKAQAEVTALKVDLLKLQLTIQVEDAPRIQVDG